MSKRLLLLRAIPCLAAALVPAAAAADCGFPAGVTESPRTIAAHLLRYVDVIGFAVVRQRQDVATGRPELIDIVYPIKGEPGTVAMELNLEDGNLIVTNGADSFGAEAGTLVFAALTRRPEGAVVTECTIQLLAAAPQGEIVREMHALTRR